ncbi:hypothetical protein WJX72_006134 [[Myrmecia] bisecta]|uniref:Uncharacterized protein n=1 Tax=[Myrmecia] bisecta TaxID=41462 RepID=A0AAW1R6X0_9CHLO
MTSTLRVYRCCLRQTHKKLQTRPSRTWEAAPVQVSSSMEKVKAVVEQQLRDETQLTCSRRLSNCLASATWARGQCCHYFSQGIVRGSDIKLWPTAEPEVSASEPGPSTVRKAAKANKLSVTKRKAAIAPAGTPSRRKSGSGHEVPDKQGRMTRAQAAEAGPSTPQVQRPATGRLTGDGPGSDDKIDFVQTCDAGSLQSKRPSARLKHKADLDGQVGLGEISSFLFIVLFESV